MMTKVVETVSEMQKISKELRSNGKKIGFVPTMGFFHEGHLSLMKAARRECDAVVVSVYVNPTQFSPSEDFSSYPRNFQHDLKLAENEGVDFVFHPTDKKMYPVGFQTFVEVQELSKKLCGKSRPTHFKGVTTVVAKLFNIVKPHVAFFGQKDYQQFLVVKRMVQDLNFDLKVKVLPIVREKDGLAMSSRNKYLSREERKSATALFDSLQRAKKLIEEGETSVKKICSEIEKRIEKEKTARIDYIEVVDSQNLKPVKRVDGNVLIALAVFIGKTRLIDNIIVFRDKK